MIKQLKQTNNIDEANELLDRGWVLLSYANDNFVLGAKEEIWGKEKEPHVSEVLKSVDENFTDKMIGCSNSNHSSKYESRQSLECPKALDHLIQIQAFSDAYLQHLEAD